MKKSTNQEKRSHLIYDLLDAKTQATLSFSKYLAANREYGQNDTLHMREAHMIVAIAPGEGKTMSELSEYMGVTQGAVSQTASRLESKGYLVRKRSEDNYRQIVAVLTKKGVEFYHKHLDYDHERFMYLDKKYLNGYSDEQLKMFREYEKLMCSIFTANSKKDI